MIYLGRMRIILTPSPPSHAHGEASWQVDPSVTHHPPSLSPTPRNCPAPQPTTLPLLKEYRFGGEDRFQCILNKCIEQKEIYKKSSKYPTFALPLSCVLSNRVLNKL